jgi:hypothetical protein
MLKDVPAPARLLHLDGKVLDDVGAALHANWRDEAVLLLNERNWRGHVIACAAALIGGGGQAFEDAVWRAFDTGSWAAPQLVATAFLVDAQFEAHAEQRLLSPARRGPKAIASLVRAYHRLPKPRMNVVAQLGVHDAELAVEEGRIGIRGVDGWLDRLPLACDDVTRARWLRLPRPALP